MEYTEHIGALQMGLLEDTNQSLEVLKKVLTDNGFKHTFSAACILLDEIEDRLGSVKATYYKTIALQLE